MRRLQAIVFSALALVLNLLLTATVLGKPMAAFQLKSSAFSNGGAIPTKFTCDGTDVSPALSWNDPPAGTKTLALIMDDPDAPAGTWVHWVLYDLPASVRELPEGVPKAKDLESGARQGSNDFRRIGYGGPCPPRGADHRYSFRLYALDRPTQLPAESAKGDLEHDEGPHPGSVGVDRPLSTLALRVGQWHEALAAGVLKGRRCRCTLRDDLRGLLTTQ